MSGTPFPQFPSSNTLLPVRTLPRIRLDRAQRNAGSQTGLAAAYATLLLYNNSPQSHVLVIRGLTWGPAASAPVGLSYFQGNFGTASSNKNQPVLPDRGLLPGMVFGNNSGTLLTADTIMYQQSLEQSYSGEYPAIVLPPAFSLVVEAQTVNVAVTVSFLWEALTPDEFTEMYGTYE
jgi:hypothetical protein